MNNRILLAIAVLLVGACTGSGEAVNEGNSAAESDSPEAKPASAAWDLQSSGEGVALVLAGASGATAIRLFCPAGQQRLLVNVPSFKPVASEERLSFGSGGDAVVLVADARGDAARGGVTGESAVPKNLAALLAAGISASYGAQTSGPHPAAPGDIAGAFVKACAEAAPTKPAPPPAAAAGACLTQDGKPVPANRLRAIGTEPFWGARIEGRCVTYSHPDDQQGTRVWTRFSGTASNGVWTGNLAGKPFVLRTRPQAGCSDGMSDRRYPVAVSLSVGGEQRTGCAEPL